MQQRLNFERLETDNVWYFLLINNRLSKWLVDESIVSALNLLTCCFLAMFLFCCCTTSCMFGACVSLSLVKCHWLQSLSLPYYFIEVNNNSWGGGALSCGTVFLADDDSGPYLRPFFVRVKPLHTRLTPNRWANSCPQAWYCTRCPKGCYWTQLNK